MQKCDEDDAGGQEVLAVVKENLTIAHKNIPADFVYHSANSGICIFLLQFDVLAFDISIFEALEFGNSNSGFWDYTN